MAASPPTQEDQGRLLEEALGVVRQQVVQMRKCLETPGNSWTLLNAGWLISLVPHTRILIIVLPVILSAQC